jgi:hypothetical protein
MVSSAVFSHLFAGEISSSLIKSLAVLKPSQAEQLKESLNKFPLDRQKAIETGVDKLFGPVFKKMFNQAFKPSDVFTVSESIAAAADGDWETAVQKGTFFLESVAYFKNLNAYLMLVSSTKELINTTVNAWAKEIYNTKAYYNAQQIIERELRDRQNPYIPSYMIKFSEKSVIAEDLSALKKTMMDREYAMFTNWHQKDADHEEAVDILITGKWASRLRQILKKQPSEKVIFNHFLYLYTSGPGNRPEIMENYRDRYLVPLSKKMAKVYKNQWSTMIINGFSQEMKKHVIQGKPSLKVKPVMNKSSAGVDLVITGIKPGTSLNYTVAPKAGNVSGRVISGAVVTDERGAAKARAELSHAEMKSREKWFFSCKVTGPDNIMLSGGWTIVMGGHVAGVNQLALMAEKELNEVQKKSKGLMKQLGTKLRADYNTLNSNIKPKQARAKQLVNANYALSDTIKALNPKDPDSKRRDASLRSRFIENDNEIKKINSALKPLYAKRRELRELINFMVDHKKTKMKNLLGALKKILNHRLTKRYDMKGLFQLNHDNLVKAIDKYLKVKSKTK